jgi:hypothetical protein
MHFGLQQTDIHFSSCEADTTCDGERRIFLYCPDIHFSSRVGDHNTHLQHAF